MRTLFAATAAFLVSFCLIPSAHAALEFTPLASFPSSPGGVGYGAAAAALGDGRFVVWDGDAIHIQAARRTDAFNVAATGYAGDPGFIAVAPDGHTCLLGAGFTGDIYRFDAAAPGPPEAPVANAPHFSAVFVGAGLLLIDSAEDLGGWVFAASLDILDLNAEPPVHRRVVSADRGASAALTLDPSGRYVFSADGMTGETRRFRTADVLNAFASETPLAWTDGALVGFFESGGPGAFTNNLMLAFGGFMGKLMVARPASIDVTDPANFQTTEQFDPDGSGMFAYAAVYSRAADQLLVVGTDYGTWPPSLSAWVAEDIKAVPAAGGMGLAVLGVALALAACKRVRR